MRILATDDDPILLELLSQHSAGIAPHEIVSAHSGSDALARLRDETIQPSYTSSNPQFLVPYVGKGRRPCTIQRELHPDISSVAQLSTAKAAAKFERLNTGFFCAGRLA